MLIDVEVELLVDEVEVLEEVEVVVPPAVVKLLVVAQSPNIFEPLGSLPLTRQ